MKIRIRSGALRYRLTRSEVALFQREGVIKETVQIGDDQLIYVLQRTAEARLSATFKNNIINLLVPEQMADEWTNTDKVGISGEVRSLHLLIEKDFTCLDNVEENQSDNYPNPLAVKDHE